jgi:hypothetical protein
MVIPSRRMAWTRLSQANAIGELQTATERTVFDLKRTYDLSDLKTVFEIAKDIVAFANNVGGTILVGGVEGSGDKKGRAVHFQTVASAPLLEAVQKAIAMCRPVPVVTPEVIKLTEQDQQIVLGTPAPAAAPVELVALNVPPMLSTPVGAPVCDSAGKRVEHAYRFPIRRIEGTEWLRPEELVFYMNSRERQILLQLEGIPAAERDVVNLWSVSPNEGGRELRKQVALVGVDSANLVLTLEKRAGEVTPVVARIPLAFVRAVWRDEQWNISVDGITFRVDPMKLSKMVGFVPTGAM